MEHVKTYNAMEVKHKNGNIIIEGPISASELPSLISRGPCRFQTTCTTT